ncbi:MAG: ABC transporter permease [Anaerolineae bacterium]
MNLMESVRISLRGLSANKLRSALTMLGIIIGVGAVIALLSVGQGVSKLITEQIQSIGSNVLFVAPISLQAAASAHPGAGAAIRDLTVEDAQAIADPLLVPDVVAVAPELQRSATVERGREAFYATVVGVTPAYAQVRNRQVLEGRFVDENDMVAGSRVALLGSAVYDSLFPGGDYPIGQTIKINQIPFRVIGVLEEKGGGGFGNQDSMVLVPLSTAHTRLFRARTATGAEKVTVINVQVTSEDRMDDVAEAIRLLLRARHKLTFRDDDDFSVISQKDILSIFGEITGVLTLFLGAIAAISLLVGGIGIMNIMLVSVTERTREIGIRKAVGAKRRDILVQFLIEAMALSLVGGAMGIVLGIVGSIAISSLSEDLVTVVTPQAILLATGFSAAVGLFFGIYPATRAARLHPIEALRYE